MYLHWWMHRGKNLPNRDLGGRRSGCFIIESIKTCDIYLHARNIYIYIIFIYICILLYIIYIYILYIIHIQYLFIIFYLSACLSIRQLINAIHYTKAQRMKRAPARIGATWPLRPEDSETSLSAILWGYILWPKSPLKYMFGLKKIRGSS